MGIQMGIIMHRRRTFGSNGGENFEFCLKMLLVIQLFLSMC